MNRTQVSPAPHPRQARERVDGILLLDKATGQSSNHALQAARRLLAAAKAGHGGTLDPMAAGLLPVLLGEATKFAADLLDADKTYEAELTLGQTSSTGDAEGEITPHTGLIPSADDMALVLREFVGRIRQLPPMHSALKHAGRPLYEYARAGQLIEREPREVEIKAIDLLSFTGTRLQLRVCCSKGTYIRTLAQDIGAVSASSDTRSRLDSSASRGKSTARYRSSRRSAWKTCNIARPSSAAPCSCLWMHCCPVLSAYRWMPKQPAASCMASVFAGSSRAV
ncbi:MAG: hypothetical protein RLZZ153_1273 [Pseudomonadota bacterium]